MFRIDHAHVLAHGICQLMVQAEMVCDEGEIAAVLMWLQREIKDAEEDEPSRALLTAFQTFLEHQLEEERK